VEGALSGLFINDTLKIFVEISSVAFFAPSDSKEA
jgi:hypothetical protein